LFLALLTTNILEKGFRNAMLKSIVPMILFNLLLGTSAMIDNAGHIGGLIAGLICGYLFSWHYKNPRSKFINILSFVLPTVLIITSGFIINKKLPDTYLAYEKIMDTITTIEKDALDLEAHPNYNGDKAIEKWDAAIAEINKAPALKLNKDIDLRNERLLFYLQKRRQEAVLLKNPIENSWLLKQTSQSVDSILKVLNSKEE
jgi:rhomboid protease GluP